MKKLASLLAAAVAAVTLVTVAPAGAASKITKSDRVACHQVADVTTRYTAAQKLQRSHASGAIRAAAKHFVHLDSGAGRNLVRACHLSFPKDKALTATWATYTAPVTTTPPPPPTAPPAPPKPTLSPDALAYIYKSSATNPSYDEFSKNPYGTTPVHFRGQVFQFDANTGPDKLLLAITPDTIGAGTSYEETFWNDNIFIQLPDAALGNGIDNKDVVDVWGDPAGTYSYEASLGTRSVPAVNAKFFELVSKG